jgi:hypothetical protein
MVAGGLSVLVTIGWLLVVSLVGVAAVLDRDAADAIGGIGVTVAAGVVTLALGAFTIYAGWQMYRLQNWGLSMAGAIAAMLPCSICCVLGLPIGIWAVLVLLDNDVKAAFGEGVGP